MFSNEEERNGEEPSTPEQRVRNFENEKRSSPPALPPRPISRPSRGVNCSCGGGLDGRSQEPWPPNRRCGMGFRKYVCLCIVCGTLCLLLGAIFLTVYFTFKTYTSSLNYFETVPTYIPAATLMTTGLLVSSLGSRKNRSPFLIKVCGACSIICALVCLSVTVSTAVIHMNRLQTLRECYYTGKTRSCTCESITHDGDMMSEETSKFIFNSTSDCDVIHGVLYSCLRAVFGLSVVGILVCIFTCMLVYQLLSHEKKKMYWAQLEMRCRYLYGQHGQPFCSCCDECRVPAPGPHDIFPWDMMGNRFIAPGRVGNLYTPNPEDRNSERTRPGWSWRRLPWGRGSSNNTSNPTNNRSRGDVGSPDSQYGFTSAANAETATESAPYSVIDNQARPESTSVFPGDDITEGGFYSWGPPPPYSSNPVSPNNSPARRSLAGILHHVTPVRRNNVSPARNSHPRNQRPPVAFERTANQGPGTSKAAPQRSANRSSQAQPSPGPSTSRQQDKTENYENTREIERMLRRDNSTLPSLKRRSRETDPPVPEPEENASSVAGHQPEPPEEPRQEEVKKRVARRLEYETPDLTKNIPRRTAVKPLRGDDKRRQHHKQVHGKDASKNRRTSKEGIENFGFQQDGRRNVWERDKRLTRDGRPSEIESDVYFADISNSSYMSVRSEDHLYEQAEPVKDQNNGQPLLNKTNLKIIEKESCKYDAATLDYPDMVVTQSPSVSLGSECQDGSQNSFNSFGSTRSANYPSLSQESSDSRKPESFQEANKIDVNNLPNQFRPVPFHSDEQSSSSLTADSGISSNRYTKSGYYCEQPETASECSLEVPMFSAAILQKPKAQPRGRRDPRIFYKKGNEEVPNPKPRKNSDSIPKPLPRTTIARPKAFLAPDAQYEMRAKAKPVQRHAKPKPAIPARPQNLTDGDNFNSGPPRRRSRGEETDANYHAASHSVNV